MRISLYYGWWVGKTGPSALLAMHSSCDRGGVKVYLVLYEDYDDYRIFGVFSSKEKAEEYIKNSNEVELYRDFTNAVEYEVDEEQVWTSWIPNLTNTSSF